jgi:hypothetical protein
MERKDAKILSDEVRVALEEVAQRHGLELRFTGATFTSGTFKPTVTFVESGYNAEEFNIYRRRFGIADEVTVGTTFTVQGKTYEVTGVRPKAQKRPITARDTRTDVEYAFTAETVNRAVAR